MALLLAIIYITFISIGLPSSLLGAAWPSMYIEMGEPISRMGILSMLITGSTVIAALFSERALKRLSAGTAAAVSVCLLAAGQIGFAASGSFALLCVCAIPLGLGIGLIDAFLNNFVAVHFKAMHMNWLHCCWGIGATAGPIILAYGMTHFGSWRWGYSAIGMLMAVLAAGLLLSLPVWKKAEKAPDTASEVKVDALKLSDVLRLPGVKLTIVTFFFYNAIETSVGLWGSGYLVFVRGVPVERAAQWISLYFFGITFGRLFSGFLSSKLAGVPMVRLGSALLAAGGIIAFTPIGGAAYPFGLFLMGIGCSPIFPSLVHMTPEIFGKERSQAIIGVQLAGAYIGSTVIPPMFGAFAAGPGYGTLPAFLVVLLIIMAASVERLRKVALKQHLQNMP